MLSRSFGRKTALDNVSFQAAAGQIYGLVGANGAGKTTLPTHLLGLPLTISVLAPWSYSRVRHT